MTPLMLRTLDFIKKYHAQHRLMPTLDEICEGVSIASRGGAHKVVYRLIEAGELVRTSAGRRNIALPSAELNHIPTETLRAELARREASNG